MRKRLLALWMAVLMVVSFMPTSYAQVTLPDAAPSAEKTEAAASPAPTPTPVAPEGTKAPGAAATPAPTQSAAQDETETEHAVAPQAASYTATFRLAPVITSNFPDQLNLKVNSAFQVGRKQVLSDISTEHEVTEVRADGTVVITFHFYSKEDSQWINTINLPRWDRVWELYGATGNKPGANIRISSSASGVAGITVPRCKISNAARFMYPSPYNISCFTHFVKNLIAALAFFKMGRLAQRTAAVQYPLCLPAD